MKCSRTLHSGFQVASHLLQLEKFNLKQESELEVEPETKGPLDADICLAVTQAALESGKMKYQGISLCCFASHSESLALCKEF